MSARVYDFGVKYYGYFARMGLAGGGAMNAMPKVMAGTTPPPVIRMPKPVAPHPQSQMQPKVVKVKKQRKHSFFTILLDIELVIAVVLVCALALPRVFGIVPDVVQSGSMEPSIPTGSIVYTDTKVPGQSLKVGDVAVYKTGSDTKVMHRITEKTGAGYTFQGDANQDPDNGLVSPQQIMGQYMFHVPFAGFAYFFFDTYKITIIAALAALNFLALALHIVGKRKRTEVSAQKATTC